jgi:hypothetical protein
LRFIKPLGEDSTPVTVKPLRVSLVEPVACRLSHPGIAPTATLFAEAQRQSHKA